MSAIIEMASAAAIEKAGKILKEGGIAAFPTETVYGLGAAFTNAAAVKRIFKVKGRDEKKPLSVLVSSPEQIYPYAEVTDEAKKIMNAFWPGPLTIVLKLKRGSKIPKEVTAGGSTIGFRMPANETALKIIERAGEPIAAPSANLSGRRSATCVKEVFSDLGENIDFIIDGGKCLIGISSTVIDMSGDEPIFFRIGTVTKKQVKDVLK